MPTSETRVWFLRHGVSTFNLEHRCQGCSDEPELTAEGRAAARLTGERLAADGIQTVISSPLRRAAHTAGEVLKILRAEGRGVAFETDDRLREVALFGWEGLPLEKIARCFPEQYRDWRLRPQEFHMLMAGNELQYPIRNLYARVRSFWNHLLASHTGKSILLVSHSGTIRALIASALGLGLEHFQRFQQSNCGLTRARCAEGSAQTTLELLNDTAHLGEPLPKLKEGRQGVRLLLIPVGDPNPEAVRRLASGLEGVAIDSLFVIGATARSVAGRVLPRCLDSCSSVSEAADADALAEQALHHDFPGQLYHRVILAPQFTLQRLLQRQLSICTGAAESFGLRPFEITSIHCPGNGTSPVLQALNMLKPVPSLVEVHA